MELLRVAEYLVSTWVNGPGSRFVIWFQGCPFRCKGCLNPELWDEKGGREIGLSRILEEIGYHRAEIEGVTFTGGEPLLQVERLVPLARAVKEMGLSLLCYTGYTLEEIMAGSPPGGEELLPYLDILIDGLFVLEQKAPLLWRGSRNQRVHFLTPRYRHLKALAEVEGRSEVELQVGEEGLTATGIFEMDFWKRLKEKINPE